VCLLLLLLVLFLLLLLLLQMLCVQPTMQLAPAVKQCRS
jgi:hypothetical protein